jgi:hypothetical protein
MKSKRRFHSTKCIQTSPLKKPAKVLGWKRKESKKLKKNILSANRLIGK